MLHPSWLSGAAQSCSRVRASDVQTARSAPQMGCLTWQQPHSLLMMYALFVVLNHPWNSRLSP